MNNPFIAEKIKNLFTLRLIYDMINVSDLALKEKEAMVTNLHELQYSIYLLDKELEDNRDPDSNHLERRWRDIYALLDQCGIPADKHVDFCSEVLKYQQHEMGMRQGIPLTKLDPVLFYTVKSCDVKLMRKILYFHIPSLSRWVKEDEWVLFDYYAEIYDDVEDVMEDAGTNNGNMFLYTIQEKGLTATLQIYSDLLNHRNIEMNRNVKLESSDFIINNSNRMLRNTLELLHKRIEQLHGLGIILTNMMVPENL